MDLVIKVTNQKGEVAFVDNEGQVNGRVKIQGDTPLVSHLDRILNHKLDLTFGGQIEQIDDKFLLKKDGVVYLYKASDAYLKEHFITADCPAFGYIAEIVKE